MDGHYRRIIGCAHNRSGRLNRGVILSLGVMLLFVGRCLAQVANPASEKGSQPSEWSFSVAAYGYFVPHEISYGSPIVSADRRWLHLEARYNYENQDTGSVWAGYNLSTGSELVFDATPMLGVVFGNTNGVAPGCELALGYKRIELSSELEYVVDIGDKNGSFLYSWNELTYSPTDWLHTGLVSQRTRSYHTDLDVQRGFSIGFSHKRVEFTTYVLNAGWTGPTVVLGLRFAF